ncbi:MAG: GIY-YIG nuclease family protein [Clostridia bacterium]|nr:GIY-YIG nuclease family protein [Clostridia bacterium]
MRSNLSAFPSTSPIAACSISTISTFIRLLSESVYYVYILSNINNRVLYIGVTSNIEKRLYEHKSKSFDGFTKRYNVHKLVYIEEYSDIYDAIAREKQLKGWRREKKNALIEAQNPEWKDFGEGLIYIKS